MSNAKSQSDLLREQIEAQNEEITEVLKVPGIQTLHTRSKDEIAAVLSNLIKSRAGITSLKFVLGSHIEITCNSNPHSQLR